MLTNPNTTQNGARAPFPQPAPAPQSDALQKLEHARQRLRFAQRSVAATEGRLLDFDTAEEISRALSAASRDLEELTLHVAVMERRARV